MRDVTVAGRKRKWQLKRRLHIVVGLDSPGIWRNHNAIQPHTERISLSIIHTMVERIGNRNFRYINVEDAHGLMFATPHITHARPPLWKSLIVLVVNPFVFVINFLVHTFSLVLTSLLLIHASVCTRVIAHEVGRI